MSLEQLRTYLMTDDAKKDLVKKARESGYEVIEEDLNCVTGGFSDDDGKKDPAGARFEKPFDEGVLWKEPNGGHFEKPFDESHLWKEPNGGND